MSENTYEGYKHALKISERVRIIEWRNYAGRRWFDKSMVTSEHTFRGYKHVLTIWDRVRITEYRNGAGGRWFGS